MYQELVFCLNILQPCKKTEVKFKYPRQCPKVILSFCGLKSHQMQIWGKVSLCSDKYLIIVAESQGWTCEVI